MVRRNRRRAGDGFRRLYAGGNRHAPALLIQWKAAANAVYGKFHRTRKSFSYLQLIGTGHDGRIGSFNACQAIISLPGIVPYDKADRGDTSRQRL
jgi:hypothetical protein